MNGAGAAPHGAEHRRFRPLRAAANAVSGLKLAIAFAWFVLLSCGGDLSRVGPVAAQQLANFDWGTGTVDLVLACATEVAVVTCVALLTRQATVVWTVSCSLPIVVAIYGITRFICCSVVDAPLRLILLPVSVTGISLVQASVLTLFWRWELQAQEVAAAGEGELDEPLLPGEKADGANSGPDGKKKKTKKFPVKAAWALLQLSKPDAGLLAIAFAFLTAAAVCEVLIPQSIARVLTYIIITPDAAKFRSSIKVLFLLSCGAGMAGAARGTIMSVASYRFVARLRQSLFNAIIEKDIAFFDATTTGELNSRLNSDVTAMGSAITLNVNVLLRDTIQSVGGVALLVHLSPTLSVIMLVSIMIYIVIVNAYSRANKRFQKETQDATAEGGRVSEEAVSLIRIVRAFSSEKWEQDRFAVFVKKVLDIGFKQAVAYGLYATVVFSITNVTIVAILLAGAAFVHVGKLSGETLTTYMFYTQYISDHVSGLGDQISAIARALGAGDKVFEILQSPPCRPVVERGMVPTEKASGDVHFSNVVFRYPTRPEVLVLDGLTFHAAKGTTVALVGPSGGGKSTVVHLLLRQYDPLAGSITFDGHDLRVLDLEWLHRQTAVVSQEPLLFSCDIKQNIAYGCRILDMDAIKAAAQLANAAEFIERLPNGYDTLIGEKGVGLSGGQRQRLAIARAILRSPALLLLDEATSALDSESEALVQAALERASQQRTVIVIAHRLSTIFNADKILVVKRGVVAEQGTHGELLAKNGTYRRLVQTQLSANSSADLQLYDTENGR